VACKQDCKLVVTGFRPGGKCLSVLLGRLDGGRFRLAGKVRHEWAPCGTQSLPGIARLDAAQAGLVALAVNVGDTSAGCRWSVAASWPGIGVKGLPWPISTGQPRRSLPPSDTDHSPDSRAVNSTPPLASRYACPAIFMERSHFDAHSGTPFGTVWNRLGIDRRNLPVWVSMKLDGLRRCDGAA
jgi:hypothetical protein